MGRSVIGGQRRHGRFAEYRIGRLVVADRPFLATASIAGVCHPIKGESTTTTASRSKQSADGGHGRFFIGPFLGPRHCGAPSGGSPRTHPLQFSEAEPLSGGCSDG